MLRYLCVALFVLISGPGLAQTVVLRGGEHDTFTRVVMATPDRLDFKVLRDAYAVTLRFAQEGLEFQSDTLFSRIPRTRLSEVSIQPEGREIVFALACDCPVETSWHGAAYLVVDIHDPKDQENPVSDTPAPRPGGHQATSAVFQIGQPEVPGVNLRSDDPHLGTAEFLITDALDRRLETRWSEARQAQELSQHKDRLDSSRSALLKELGKAASQGLLSPRVPRANLNIPEADTPLVPVAEPEQAVHQKPPAARHQVTLRAESSINQSLSETLHPGMQMFEVAGCPEAVFFDVRNWAEEQPFADQLGTLRSKLVAEFDQPSIEAVRNLARFYIHFGFGAEVRQIIEQFPVALEESALLLAMADILDDGANRDLPVLNGLLDCPPDVAVWSAMSYDVLPSSVPLDPEAILRGFSKLPMTLRHHIGPELGHRLRQAGYEKQADHVKRALFRHQDGRGPSTEFLRAQSALTKDATYAAENALESVVASNTEPSAEALMKLIESRQAQGSDISFNLAQLAGAYAFEYRNHPLGPQLSRTYLTALAASGAYDQAFEELPHVLDRKRADTVTIRSELYEMLTKGAPDEVFVRHAVSRAARDAFPVSEQVENDLAKRLLRLGFVQSAFQLTEARATDKAQRDRKILRAEIALVQGHPRHAELSILGLSGRDVLALRARARSMAGEHRAASGLFEKANRADEHLQEAWLSTDWETLQVHPEPAIQAMAMRMVDLQEAGDEEAGDKEATEPVLVRNAELIAESTELREMVQALLQTSPISDATEN